MLFPQRKMKKGEKKLKRFLLDKVEFFSKIKLNLERMMFDQ